MSWRANYGLNIQERSRRIANGIVPITVLRENIPPIRSQIFEFDYCHRTGGRALRNDPNGRAYFNSRQNRYVEDFNLLPNRSYIFVRSQRYGELLEQTRSDRNPDPMHIIDEAGRLKSIYIVTLSNTIASQNWAPVACSCESRSSPCKHMMAVAIVKQRTYSATKLKF